MAATDRIWPERLCSTSSIEWEALLVTDLIGDCEDKATTIAVLTPCSRTVVEGKTLYSVARGATMLASLEALNTITMGFTCVVFAEEVTETLYKVWSRERECYGILPD